ncbi:MAG: putative metal-binding motif-containing protein [Myxococcota bacterium]
MRWLATSFAKGIDMHHPSVWSLYASVALLAWISHGCSDGTVDAGQSCVDRDQDTYGESCAAGPDCDDALVGVHPGVTEVCGDGVDQDCSGSDAACPSGTNTTATRVVGTTTFVWTYSCNEGDCSQGTFLGGDIWIAPKVPGEVTSLVSVTTSGIAGGMELNPTSPSQQGFLWCPYHSRSYSAVLNLSSSLPIVVTANSSIVKATQKTTGCQPATSNCCIDTYDVLTVLPTPPSNNGALAFRPGMAGTNKRIFYLADFDFSLIPSDSRVNASGIAADFSATAKRWFTPYVDHYMWKLGDPARSFAPTGIPDYGADQGAIYLNDLIRAMGTESLASKQEALEGLLQRGIDLYTSYRAGIQWPAGAGQQEGRKPAVAFFAALVSDAAIKAEVQALHDNNGNYFHEDGQININTSTGNVPVWGDYCTEEVYWSTVFYAQSFDGGSGVQIGSGDNVRTCRDPYGWIDGPGGLPGTEYMACCSTGEFISYQLAQSLMPAYCTAANDPQLSTYTRRVLTTGVHTQPDGCAPPDPREPTNCAPYAAGAPNCQYYKITWGPDPANPGDCIRNASGQTGRFPLRNGYIMPDIYYESPISKTMRQQNGVTILNACN